MINEIENSNKIPGSCDKFTNPSEIHELEKFIKKQKDYLEDNLDLLEDNLELFGSRQGLIKKIDNLDNHREKIIGPKEIELEVNKDNGRLSVSNIDSDDLPGEKYVVVDDDEKSLSNIIEGLAINDQTSLQREKEELKSAKESNNLGSYKDNISPNSTKELKSTKETISNKQILELDNTKDSLNSKEVGSLTESRETLSTVGIEEITSNLEKISTKGLDSEIELAGEKYVLINEEEPDKLTNGKSKLEGVSNLSSLREDLSNEQLINSLTLDKLDQNKDTITEDQVESLPEGSIKLTDSLDDKLTSSDLNSAQEKINVNSKISELTDKKESITVNEESVKLEQPDLEKLDTVDISLDDFLDDLEDKEEKDLSTTVENLSKPNIVTNIQDTETISEIKKKEVENLSFDIVDNYLKVSDKEEITLPTEGVTDISDPNTELEDLPESSLTIDSEKQLDKLNKGYEEIAPHIKTDDGRSHLVEIDGFSEDFKAELYDVEKTRQSKNLDLYYNSILKFANNLDRFSGTSYGAKVSSIVSTYLSGEKISKARIEEFEKALYTSIMPNLSGVTEDWQTDNIPSNLSSNKGSQDISSENKDEVLRQSTYKATQVEKPLPNDISPSTQLEDRKIWEDEDGLKQNISFSPHYKLPNFFSLNSGISGAMTSISAGTNVSSYLRWVAENTVGMINSKGVDNKLTSSIVTGVRAKLLDEALSLLIIAREKAEKILKANRDRLPGNESIFANIMKNGIGATVVNSVNKALDTAVGIKHSTPKNRPVSYTEGWTDNTNKSYSFKDNYLIGDGINCTLSELDCGNPGSIRSVEELFDAIKRSKYMNSSDKYVAGGDHKISTLDSNYYWEIKFTPFVGEENDNTSYLPAIEELNLINKKVHGVATGYSSFVPITSFELSKSRLMTKNLQLYDGEISYPISMEFTNELRLTFADDQFKSFRTYFEKCADVSVYNSLPHDKDWYDGKHLSVDKSTNLTTVSRNYRLVAPYKNITFRCTIYSMTPQRSTISKYDLLVLMKDFSEERFGDSSPTDSDLTLNFSIVGENPKS